MARLTSKGIYTVRIQNHPCTIMPPKTEIMRRGGYKCRTLEMHLQWRDQQLKTISYIHIDSYIKISGQLQTKNLQLIYKQTRKTTSNTILKIVIKPQEERTREVGKKKRVTKNKSKTVNKVSVRTYISIITLNVNGINTQPKDID